ILGNFKENVDGDRKPDGSKPEPGDKKPGPNNPADKKPADKKPDGKKPDDAIPEKKPDDTKPVEKKPTEKVPGLVGTVKAISDDGKTIPLVVAPTEKNKEPAIQIQVGKDTTITAGKEPGKLAVGQTVIVFLAKGEEKIATAIQIGKPGEQPVKKP